MIKRIKKSFNKNVDAIIWVATVCTLICTLTLYPIYLLGWYNGFRFSEYIDQKAKKIFMNTEEIR